MKARLCLSLLLLLLLLGSAGPAWSLSPVQSSSTAARGASVGDDWAFYLLRVDDEPASIYLNLALARKAPVSAQPNMAYVRIKMRQSRPDGLSSSEEFETLSAIEDKLVEAVARTGNVTYAGRNTSGGNRDFYFYTADPASFARSARTAMAQAPEYQFEVGGRQDPNWSVYFNFLYPSADDLERIGNRRVNDVLEGNGDDLSRPRPIHHLARMPDIQKAEALRAHLRQQRFTVGKPQIEAGAINLRFERIDAPEQMDEVVVPIARRVRELGGDYDGWGSEVTASRPSERASQPAGK